MSDLKNNIVSLIHDQCTDQGGIYSALFFSEETEKIADEFTFSFMCNKNDDYDEDVTFFLNNIIAKIFELNYNINPRFNKLDVNGRNIILNDIKTNIWFLTEEYHIEGEDFKLHDLENYLDDLNIIEQGDRYIIELKIPIYKIDKSAISIL